MSPVEVAMVVWYSVFWLVRLGAPITVEAVQFWLNTLMTAAVVGVCVWIVADGVRRWALGRWEDRR